MSQHNCLRKFMILMIFFLISISLICFLTVDSYSDTIIKYTRDNSGYFSRNINGYNILIKLSKKWEIPYSFCNSSENEKVMVAISLKNDGNIEGVHFIEKPKNKNFEDILISNINDAAPFDALRYDNKFRMFTLLVEYYPNIYSDCSEDRLFLDSFYSVRFKKNISKYIIIENISQEKICEDSYDKAFEYKFGYSRININNQYNFVNYKCNYLSEYNFEDARDFSDGIAAVKINGLWGFVNNYGNLVIKNVYREVNDFSEGLAPVKLDDGWGYIDHRGVVVIPLTYEKASSFKNNKAYVMKMKTQYIIDRSGSIVDKVKTHHFEDEIPKLVVNDLRKKKGYILKNRDGEIFYDINYDDVWNFYDNTAKIRIGGKYGFINNYGERIIAIEYDDAMDFKDGYARVKKNNKWGLINLKNEIIVDFKYDYLWDISGKNIKARNENNIVEIEIK